MSIPRRLHQIWLGPRPVPRRWADRWQRRHRGWAYRLWREPDIEAILPDELRPAWTHFIRAGRWHGAADVGRLAILLRDGGVYVDIDSEPVRSLDRAPFMRGGFFAGLETGTPERPGHITNGVIGSEPAHPILQAYARLIADATVIEPPWKTVGGGFLTAAVLANRDLPGVTILPIRTFYPEDKDGRAAPGKDRIYARQYWATTHRLYAHEGESWQNLRRRRRGEPVVDPWPVRVRRRARGLVRRALPFRVRRWLRALMRRLGAAFR